MITSLRSRLMPLLILMAFFAVIGRASAQDDDTTHTLVITPSLLNYLDARVGVPMTQTFTIRNRASAIPVIITLSQPANPIFTYEGSGQFTLSLGESRTITVQVLPTKSGNYNSTLLIEHSAFDLPSPLSVKLLTQVLRGDIGSDSLGLSIPTRPVSFGMIATGTLKKMSVRIKNESNSFRYTGIVSSPRAPFTVGNAEIDLPAGQSHVIDIYFEPTAPGTFLDSIVITGNANDSARPGDTTVRIMIAGRAYSGTQPTDSLALVSLPDTVSFGSVDSGSVEERFVVITNTSQSDTLTGVVSGGHTGLFTAVTDESFFKMAPGETRLIAVRFAPLNGDMVEDHMTITYSTQDPNSVSQNRLVTLLGNSAVSGVDGVDRAGYALSQNYPNPASGITTIDVAVAKAGQVTMNLFNTRGELVRKLVDGRLDAGTHTIRVDASGLEAGVYIYHMQSNGISVSQRMTVVR